MGRLLTRGHPAAAAAIQAMVAGHAPHAIVLAGAPGVGKTTLALDLAAGLLCDAPDPSERPCRECRGCRLVAHGSHADLHRLAPMGPGGQVRIGDRTNPDPGTVRRLIADLALLPVEGGNRVAIVERADRLNEDAQSALLKILEEPPAGVTIVLCADRDDLLLPTVMSRCVRVRLGPVAIREIEALLEDAGVADAPRANRLARLSRGRPGAALALALAPEAVTARDEIARTLLDLAGFSAAKRLSVGRELLSRAAELVAALDRAGEPRLGAEAGGDGAGQARIGPSWCATVVRGRGRGVRSCRSIPVTSVMRTKPTETTRARSRFERRRPSGGAPRSSSSRSGATWLAICSSSPSARSGDSAIPPSSTTSARRRGSRPMRSVRSSAGWPARPSCSSRTSAPSSPSTPCS